QVHYEVLVIPDRPVAPQVFTGLPAELGQYAYKLDDGVPISGRITGAKGPVANARLLLRAGSLPSTVGIADATGAFTLRARSGDFAAVVVPPSGAGLPEAHIALGNGLQVDFPPPARIALDFRWNAIPTVTIDLTIRTADDTAVTRPVRV